MMERFKFLLVLSVICCAMAVSANAQNSSSATQNITVKGVVVDEQGLPAIGASVLVAGSTSMGTVTDEKGSFTIKVPAGSVLNVSYVGYADQSRKVTRDLLDWYVQLELVD